MKKFIDKNIELIVKVPIIIYGLGIGWSALSQVTEDFRQGLSLFMLGALVLFLERIVKDRN